MRVAIHEVRTFWQQISDQINFAVALAINFAVALACGLQIDQTNYA